jgi:hypothetical protein
MTNDPFNLNGKIGLGSYPTDFSDRLLAFV